MKKKLALLLQVAILSACGSLDSEQAKEGWIQLYNGRDLTGWTPKFSGYAAGENYLNTFQAADSLLRVSYANYDTFAGEFGHLFYEKSFSHYRVRLQYVMEGEQVNGGEGWAYANNGLMLHAQAPASMSLNQDFPLSIEFQFLGARENEDRPTGNLCTPGCHVAIDGELYEPHCATDYSGPSYHESRWVTAEAIVLGDSIIHHVIEGDTVFTYTNPVIGGGLPGLDTVAFQAGNMMGSGYLAIQAESHGIAFKNIEVLDLCGCMDQKAKNYRSYFVKSKPSSCVY